MLKPTPTPTDGYKKRATWEDVQRERARQVKERLEKQPFETPWTGPDIYGHRVRWNGREMIWNPAGSATAVTIGTITSGKAFGVTIINAANFR